MNLPRTIPAALRDSVEAELEDMEKRGVIRRVEEPTDLAVVEKADGGLHICLDPRHLNKAIKREQFFSSLPLRISQQEWRMRNGLPS